jgi:hypothetical protein
MTDTVMTDTVMTEAGPKALQGGVNGPIGGDNAVSATTSTVSQSQDGSQEKTRAKDTGDRQENNEEESEEGRKPWEEMSEEERDEKKRWDEENTYTPDQRRLEIQRILRWPEWAYYEILDVAEDADNATIKTAFRKKSILTHTDRNDDVHAKDVFQSKCKIFKDMTEAKAEHRSLQCSRDPS